MTDVKFGKLPARPLNAVARLDRHITGILPPPPATLDWASDAHIPANGWGMMLNDRLGDCTCAGVGHSVQLMTGVASGTPVTLPDAAILALYEAVSGYNPATGANDNGANEDDVLTRWRTQGVDGDKILAHGRVDHSDVTLVKQVINLLGYAYIGTLVPAAWQQAPAIWTVPPRGAGTQIVGGHCVILTGWDTTGFHLISWGQEFVMTFAAFRKYVDEVHGVISRDWMETNGQSPTGVDLPGLLADLEAHESAA